VARRPGIFLRIVTFGLAVSLPPLAALGLTMIDVNADALRTSSRQLHLAIAADVRRAIRGEIGRAEEELTGIGQLLLAPGLGDDEKRLALVGAKVTASDRLDYVTLYGPDGARAGSLKAKEAPEPKSPEKLDDKLLAALAKRRLSPGEAQAAGLPLAAAIEVDGVVKGYLTTTLRLDRLDALVKELGERRLESADAVVVVDDARRVVLGGKRGEALAHKGIFAALQGNPSFSENEFGVSPEFTEGGRAMLGALETVPELGWAVVARQPRDLAYASLDTMRRSVIVAAVAAALFSLLAGLFLTRRFSRPIGALVQATRDLGARRYVAMAPVASRRGDEIGELARAFDQMAHDLDATEKKVIEEAAMRQSLARFMSPDVVDLILKDPTRLRLGGERREVTVMFADVCGFTQILEKIAPEKTVALLNELFTVATEIVQKRGGIIDKFVGDAVMGVWGAPEVLPDDALRAVRAADDIRRWVSTANRRWRQVYGVEVQLAFGLNTGPAIAGNIGSEKRMEYTVIGEVVNVAARLETMAQPGQILMSEATQRAVGGAVPLRALGERGIQGRGHTTLIFEVPE
jgi:adenylate cyclase